MGWLFSSRWPNRAAMVAHLQSAERFGPNLRRLKSRVVGNNHWYLYGPTSDPALVIVGLDLMKGGTRAEPGWGYKDLDETVGPCEVNCPLSLIKEASEPANEWAREWREKVRQYHANRSRKAKPTAGMVVCVGDTDYELVAPWPGHAMGWRVRRTSDGTPFRMPLRHLNQALLIAAREAPQGDAPASGVNPPPNPSPNTDQLALVA